MPRFDRTGPEGEGPRSGRELGKCNPVSEDSPDERVFGRGFGRGRNQSAGKFRGRGRGLGRNR